MNLKSNNFFSVSDEVGRLPLLKAATASALGIPVILYGESILPFTTVKNVMLPGRTILPKDVPPRSIFFAWHKDFFLDWFLARKCPELSGIRGVTQDGFAALALAMPSAFRGLPVFIFTLKNRKNRISQLSEIFNTSETPIVIHPDSGGPFLKVKPGLLKLAAATHASLIPLAFRCSPRISIGKHLNHQLPVPTSVIKFALGNPISFDGRDEVTTLRDCGAALETLEREI